MRGKCRTALYGLHLVSAPHLSLSCGFVVLTAKLLVTHQCASPTWLRRSHHKVRLKDVHLYVFCDDYQPLHQRRGAAGEFEIAFLQEERTSNPLTGTLARAPLSTI